MNADEVWQRVQEFARQRLEDQQPVFTSDRGVRNFISEVNATNIGRRSDDGTTNSSKVTRSQVERVWAELNGGLQAGSVLYFTYALIAAALPDVVESTATGLRLRDRESPPTIESAGNRARMTGRVFGHVVGLDDELIAVGTIFRGRAELAAAGVHRPPMAGISGSAGEGADSIVLSGGYEDDWDLGEVIVYTGHGGQDERTKRQVRDQEFTRGNKALAVSCVEGLPVRVVRGADPRSGFAPTSGYRYDGLFRVEEYWQERGRAGFLMCRFRLVRWTDDAGVVAEIEQRPELPQGDQAPQRRSSTTQRVVRNTAVGTEIKRLYDHRCQVCGIRLESAAGAYAEAAHIRALGRPHNGPDVPANVLCLCPNHHVLFDLGAIYINDDLSIGGLHEGQISVHPRHGIDLAHVAYHRERHVSTARLGADVDDEIAPAFTRAGAAGRS